MPRIQPYEQQTRTPRQQAQVVDFGSGDGAAAVGAALGQMADDHLRLQVFARQKEEERAAVWANEQITESRSRWIEELPRRQAAASETAEGFAGDLLSDFDSDADERIKTAPTEASRAWLKERLGQTRIAIQQDALAFEARRGVEYKVNGLGRAIDSARAAAEFQPRSYEVIAAEQIAAIDASGLPADLQGDLREKAITALASASVQGMIRRNPQEALKEINDEKTQNAAVRHLPFDARQQLRNAAESEINRREAEAKHAQVEARQALGERVKDASASYRLGLEYDDPPTRAEFTAALGTEGGNKAYEAFTKEQQLGTDLRALALMPPEDQQELLAKRAPTGTADVADAADRYRVLLGQAQQLNKLKQDDPAGYVTRYNRSVAATYAKSGESPEAAQAYATSALAEQRRLGVAQPKLLPEDAADAIAQSFQTSNGEPLVALIQSEKEKWGEHWPQVYGELAAKKMPATAMAIGRGMAPGAAIRLASLSTVKLDELKKGVTEQPRDVSDKLDSDLVDLQRSLDGVIGGEATFSGIYEAAEKLSYSYLRQGKSLGDATSQAYAEVIGDHYTFSDFHGRTFRIPIAEATDGIEDGARAALEMLKPEDLQAPIPTSQSSQDSAGRDLVAAIQRKGYWVTSANQERGLALFVDGYPVLRPDGRVYELTWDQLRSEAVAHSEAARRKRVERSALSAPGLR